MNKIEMMNEKLDVIRILNYKVEDVISKYDRICNKRVNISSDMSAVFIDLNRRHTSLYSAFQGCALIHNRVVLCVDRAKYNGMDNDACEGAIAPSHEKFMKVAYKLVDDYFSLIADLVSASERFDLDKLYADMKADVWTPPAKPQVDVKQKVEDYEQAYADAKARVLAKFNRKLSRAKERGTIGMFQVLSSDWLDDVKRGYDLDIKKLVAQSYNL